MALAQRQAPIVNSLPVPPREAAAPSNIHPAVARIVAQGNGSVSFGSGTLVYANDDAGVVITNWHVINEATGAISVHFPDGFYSIGKVASYDRDWDLAAIAIRRPPGVQPVSLANEAPRPGDLLTIAGYGSGNYRAASGRCTQYVAPGTSFPYEMVEVAVSARQGDSGGPIFNQQGELAGVLFGEGHGRTSGSYCGRVKWFLASVAPDVAAPRFAPEAPSVMVASSERADVPPATASRRSEFQTQPGMQNVTPRRQAGDHATRSPRFVQGPPANGQREASGFSARPAEPAAIEAQHIGWEDLAGATTAEQIRTVLAGVGVLAILVHALKWLSREPAKSA